MDFYKFNEIIKGTIIKYENNFNYKISVDTRTLKKNDIFIPISFKDGCGNKYILDAVKRGASLILIPTNYLNETNILEDILNLNNNVSIIEIDDGLQVLIRLATYIRNNYKGLVIGITGSNGKTSTKEIMYQVLSEKYKVFKSIDNFNNILGMTLMMLEVKDEDILIFEMGMNHLKEISQMSKILKPDIGVITNIGTAHIGNLGSKENILKAKLEIMDGFKINSKLFINDNIDVNGKNIIRCDLIPYKIDENSIDIVLDDINIKLKLKGVHNVYNINLVYNVCKYLGLSTEKIISGLKKYKSYRMNEYIINDSLVIDDSYNSNYESVINGIKYINITSYKNKILVLGDIKELGVFSTNINIDIAKYINNTNISKVYTYGVLSKDIYDNLEVEKYHYDDIDILINDIEKELNNDTIIYIKGSHSMHMDKIVKVLIDKNGHK